MPLELAALASLSLSSKERSLMSYKQRDCNRMSPFHRNYRLWRENLYRGEINVPIYVPVVSAEPRNHRAGNFQAALSTGPPLRERHKRKVENGSVEEHANGPAPKTNFMIFKFSTSGKGDKMLPLQAISHKYIFCPNPSLPNLLAPRGCLGWDQLLE